jgi:hypothetical protein
MYRFFVGTMLTWVQGSDEGLIYFAIYMPLQISISTSGVGMKLIDFHAQISTKCANENAQIKKLIFQPNQMKDSVQADENVHKKRSAKIHDFCLRVPFGKSEISST